MSTPQISNSKTTIVMVEDDIIIRSALERSLAPEYEIVASVGNGAAGVDAVQQHCPDIVLLDISIVDEPFRRGATGYVRKGNVPDLKAAITTVLNGQHHHRAFC